MNTTALDLDGALVAKTKKYLKAGQTRGSVPTKAPVGANPRVRPVTENGFLVL